MCPLSCYQSPNGVMITHDRNGRSGQKSEEKSGMIFNHICVKVCLFYYIKLSNLILRLMVKFNERFLNSA